MIGEAHEYHLLILEKHLDTFGHVDDAGELCCDAMFTIGLFDLTARRLIRPTPEWARALGLRPEDLRIEGGGNR
jgi:hypothetical protein